MARGRERGAAVARRAARIAVQRLPSRAQDVVRGVYRAVVPVAPPAQPLIVFPPDVGDPLALRRFLADTDVFGGAPHEGAAYLDDSLERFRITMAMLPDLPTGARVLELGSNPYFLTRLLRRRGLHVTSANFFGEDGPRRRTQTVASPAAGVTETFEFDHFNVERERFPYEDASFDLVLCCEILEHLPFDPTHLLAECHRVLRRGTGKLLLTTPNATRLENVVAMNQGHNIYESISGYGTYGRHNRVYTLSEVRRLLADCGYAVHDAFVMDIHDHTGLWAQVPPLTSILERGCNIFALAGKAVDDPRWSYPTWLYQSIHGYRRIVADDLRVGYNDDLQSRGLHPLEHLGGGFARWTGAADEAAVDIVAPEGSGPVLTVDGLSAPRALGRPLTLSVAVEDSGESAEIPSTGEPFSVSWNVAVTSGQHTVRLRCDTWSPRDEGIGDDARRLGVCITGVRFRPADDARPVGVQQGVD